jgi:uncharacterized protein YdeI (BOF family)
MYIKPAVITLLAILPLTPAFAGNSGRHSVASANHSALASQHGSAASAAAASTVLAAPIIAFGATVTISGAALESVGEGALILGTDLVRAGTVDYPQTTPVRPNGAPTLD